MHPLVDRTYTWKGFGDGFGNWEGYCRLRIFIPHPEQQIVVVTDLGQDTGTSITNCAEGLATLVVHDFQLDPTILIWIEQYSGTNIEFSLVRFESTTRASSVWIETGLIKLIVDQPKS